MAKNPITFDVEESWNTLNDDIDISETRSNLETNASDINA